jgi:phosphoserine phosphatase RsbU/P
VGRVPSEGRDAARPTPVQPPEPIISLPRPQPDDDHPILRLADYGDSPTFPSFDDGDETAIIGYEPTPGFDHDNPNSPQLPSPASPPLLVRELHALREQNRLLRAEVRHLRERDHTVHQEITRLDEELRLAARLQRDFMPRNLPTLAKVRFHLLFRPAGYVSGDLYEAARLDEKHIGFYMADAVGHGMPAALLTMFIRQAMQMKETTANSYRLLRPGTSLGRLNAALVGQELANATFATALCGLINAETGELLLASAGHPRPLLIPRSGEVVELPTEGALLGIFEGEQFADTAHTLHDGDRLVLFTDGVEVAFTHPTPHSHPHSHPNPHHNPHNSAPDPNNSFDSDRWKHELLRLRDEPAEHMLNELASTLDSQRGSLTPGDDLTVLILEFGQAAG